MTGYVVSNAYCCDVGCCLRTFDQELRYPGFDELQADQQVSRPMFEVIRDSWPEFGDDNDVIIVEYHEPVEEFFTKAQPDDWYLTGQRWETRRAWQEKQGLEPFD